MSLNILIRKATPNDYKFISALNLELGCEFPEDKVKTRIQNNRKN